MVSASKVYSAMGADIVYGIITLKMVGQRLRLSTPVDYLGSRLYRQRLRPRELSSAKNTYQPNEDQVNGYGIVQDSRHLLHSRLAFLRWTTHPE